MGSEKQPLKERILFNPTEQVSRDGILKKVPMDLIVPFTRRISGFEYASFTGGAKFRNGDTLLARITPCLENGKTAFVDILDEGEVAFGSTEFIVMRPKEGLCDNKFVYYLSISPFLRDIAIKSMVGSTGRQRVQQNVLENTLFDFPDLPTQCSIAATLSCLDDKIELNTRIIANLEAQAQAIFKSWFVDFEPFQDGEFEDSELGLIPKGWRVQTIESIAEKIAMGPFGSNIKVDTFVSAGIPIISGQHLRGLFLDEISYNYVTEEHAKKLRNSLVCAKDIIFTHAGNIGQVAQIPDGCDYSCYIISQRQFYLRCDRKKVVPEYVNFYFHNVEGQGRLLANATQTGVPSIARPSSHMKAIIITIPPFELQHDWYNIVEPMLKNMTILKKENRRLQLLRDALLPKLVSGELEVPINY